MSLLWLIIPAWPARQAPEDMIFGPVSWREMMTSIVEMTLLASVLGAVTLRSSLLPETWKRPHEKSKKYSRTSAELLLVAIHNSLVVVLSLISYYAAPTHQSRDWWALRAFAFEIGYEVFDTVHTNRRLSPDALIHHICSPVAIATSAFTKSDIRLLLHLAVCMDVSGAWLAGCKLVSRHWKVDSAGSTRKSARYYRWMLAVYLPCRVVFPIYDIALIVMQLCYLESPFGTWSLPPDWTRPYIWSMAVLMAFNCYFCWILVKKSFPSRFPRVTSSRGAGGYEVPLRDRLVSAYDTTEDSGEYTIIQPTLGGGRAV
ncbi:hypothetical protein FOZ61_006969 [Perkinsus olseni]|uniref:TLC domain-containing protein n=1 Tax=Perkinsus olseni TaxID=32597 RepID=A0A7J6M9U8_PEROL|nr:hypothetical protein FOZ61_006969 [Perkinsus olseni]